MKAEVIENAFKEYEGDVGEIPKLLVSYAQSMGTSSKILKKIDPNVKIINKEREKKKHH